MKKLGGGVGWLVGYELIYIDVHTQKKQYTYAWMWLKQSPHREAKKQKQESDNKHD